MRRLFPVATGDSAAEVDLRTAYAYPSPLPDRGFVRGNMVASVDGAAAVDGRSTALGGAPDKAVFDTLRGLCDAVVVGAGTARVEGYRALRAKPAYGDMRLAAGQPAAPVLVLVSARLDLDPASDLFHGGVARTVVVTSANSPEDSRQALSEVAEVIVAGTMRVDMAAALDALADHGLRRVLCEGGPHLLADVAATGRLDELCLTFAPVLVGGSGPRIVSGNALDVQLELAHLLEQDGVLLARYRCR